MSGHYVVAFDSKLGHLRAEGQEEERPGSVDKEEGGHLSYFQAQRYWGGRGMAMTQWGCTRRSVLRGIADFPRSKKVKKTAFRKEVANVGDCANDGP